MTPELATSRYATFDLSMGVPVGITLGRPKFPLRYEIAAEIRELAPWGLMKLDGEQFVRAYRDQLERLDLDALLRRFQQIGEQHGRRRLVLLCYEDVHAGQLCHRRVAAEWLEEQTGQQVPELENLATKPTQTYGQLRLDDQTAKGCDE